MFEMLEIDDVTGYSAHTLSRTYTCEDWGSWQPSAAKLCSHLAPIFHRRDHFYNLTSKPVSVPISERHL